MATGIDIVAADGAQAPGRDIVPLAPISEFIKDAVPESNAEAEAKGPDEQWRFWQQQISAGLTYERRFRQEAQAAEIMAFGPDDDPGPGASSETTKTNRITDMTALIRGNIEVLKPLLFSETPVPIVQRRFRGDGKKDPTALMAAEAGQRLATYLVSTTPFDAAMCRVRDDWLIAGRGGARALYRATFGPAPEPDPLTGDTVETKTDESVLCSSLEWRRLLLAPSHGWEQMPWIAFEVAMTRSRISKRFGEEMAARFAYNAKGLSHMSRAPGDEDRENQGATSETDRTGDITNNPFDTATVWEIWDKESRSVIWWSPDFKESILDKDGDPFLLEGFYPMPKPLLATTKGESLVPRPDIRYYEQAAREIDIASEKIKSILNVISVSGLFPGTMADEVKKLLDGNNTMIPVSAWIALLEKGGTSGIVQWLPLEAMITALNALAQLRESAKQRLFENSGISDVMRSAGDPANTATQASLEGRYAGMRLSSKQREMAIYARDMLRIMLELAVTLFDTSRIADICGLDLPLTEQDRQMMQAQNDQIVAAFQAEMQQFQAMQRAVQQAEQLSGQPSGIEIPPPPEEPKLEKVPETSWELVHAVLKSDISRKIVVQIETQSTILADEQADKEARVEFIKAFASMLEMLMPMALGGQFPMKTIKEILMFGVRGFPKSRTLESMIGELPDELPPQGEPAPDPTVIAAKIRAEVDVQIKEMDMADSEADRQLERELKGADILAKKDIAETTKDAPAKGPFN